LRRLQRAGRDDRFAPRAHGAPRTLLQIFDTCRAAILENDPGRVCAGPHGKIGA
jgi:hypothetical protein